MITMKQKIKDILLASIPFVTFLIIWFIIYYFNLFPIWLVPSPFKAVSTFWKLIIDTTLIKLISISAINSIPAFILALVCAVIFGTIIGINVIAKKIFYPFLTAIYPIPSLAWLPFIILFLGFTRESIWFVIFISSFMKIIYSVIGGVQNVKQNWILVARNLELSKFEIILKVILPGALPQIITGIRLGFGSAWRSLIGAEMLVATLGGLGKFIWQAQWFFDFDKVIAGIVVISLISIFIEEIIFKRLENNTLVKWGFIREDYNI